MRETQRRPTAPRDWSDRCRRARRRRLPLTEIDVYGRINVTLQNSDEAAEEQVELQNNSSRVGVKGEKALNAGLKAIYQLEWGVNLDGESGDDNFTPRNQFVGLEGAFGTVKVGRHDTALKQAQGISTCSTISRATSPGSSTARTGSRTTSATSRRLSASHFSVTVNFFPGEDPATGNDGVADAASVSLNYETDLIYAAVAHDRDIDGEGVETTRLVGGYTLRPRAAHAAVSTDGCRAVEEDGFGASLAWTFGKNTAKVQYLTADIWRTDPQADPLDEPATSRCFQWGSITSSARTPSCSGSTRPAISVEPARATTTSPSASSTISDVRYRLHPGLSEPTVTLIRQFLGLNRQPADATCRCAMISSLQG